MDEKEIVWRYDRAQNQNQMITILHELTLIPEYLEYSEKDDKFRLIAAGRKNVLYINLGRIMSCRKLLVAFRSC